MTQEGADKALSVLKKVWETLLGIIGLCFIAIGVVVVGLIVLFVGLEFYHDSKAAEKQNDCVHLQGVPGCYRNPNGYYGGPHEPYHDDRPMPASNDYRTR